MALDNDRNRVLLSLRERPAGVNSLGLIEALGLSREVVERHLLYCADYGLATWPRNGSASKLAVITPRGCDYLVRQGL
jgi:hypothetical protein